jgi:phytoene synthase
MPHGSPQLQEHYALCEKTLYENDRDAWLSALFAPKDQRPHLHALDAFADELAGVRQKVTQPLLGEMRLRWWIDALAGDAGARAHPIADALLDTLNAVGLPHEDVEDFIDAHVFDLYDDPMATLEDLEDYCRRSGGRLFGWRARALGTSQTEPVERAGLALALTKILLAFPRHAASGQCFIPASLLAEHGVAIESLRSGIDSTGLRAALARLRDLARDHFDAAKRDAATLDPSTRAALLPASLVPLYLQAMAKSANTPFAPFAEPPQWRKQWRLWRASRGLGL